MDDHSPYNCGHEGGTDEESVPVLESTAWIELKYKVVVYSGASPHEYVASIQENMQAKKRKRTAKANNQHDLVSTEAFMITDACSY